MNGGLEHSFVCAGPRAIDKRVPTGATVLPTCNRASDKQFFEGLPELTRHTAIYSKVDWIGNDNEEIRYQNENIRDMVVQDLDNRAGYYVEDSDDGHGYFHEEENRDHDYQHQGGAVRISEPLALRFSVLFEQLLSVYLGRPHGPEEEHVQDN